MTFPEKQPTSILDKFGKFVSGFFTGQEAPKELVVPNHEQVQEESFHIFLEDHRRLLTNLKLSRKRIQVTYSMCVNEIQTLFQQLRVQSLCSGLHSSDKCRVAGSLAKVFYCPP
jgi:hypothetical protein